MLQPLKCTVTDNHKIFLTTHHLQLCTCQHNYLVVKKEALI